MEKFGQIVYRVPIDVGFDCPNRDGKRAYGGCTFCDERGSGAPTIEAATNVREQLLAGIERVKKRYHAKKYLAYFQAFTNTYAPEGILKVLYETGIDHPDVVGICIGTRPDCLQDNILDLLAEFNKKTFVFLEIGLQSAHDKTLNLINRAHTSAEFFDSVKRAKERNLAVATHLIFGLPEENKRMMLDSVQMIANTQIDALKLHQLCIYKGAPMEADYKSGKIETLDEDEYVHLICDALEILPERMAIMRLVAEGSQTELISPVWSFEKVRILDKIIDQMKKRGTKQGIKFQVKQNIFSSQLV